MLAGIFNFIESEKLKGNSLYCPVDFYRARASSCSPVFSILKSLKNLKKLSILSRGFLSSPGQFLLAGVFNFKESEKLKEDSHLVVVLLICLSTWEHHQFFFSLLVISKKKKTSSHDTPMYRK
jgi:hypothetical protein